MRMHWNKKPITLNEKILFISEEWNLNFIIIFIQGYYKKQEQSKNWINLSCSSNQTMAFVWSWYENMSNVIPQ